jgi:hypothetical protein
VSDEAPKKKKKPSAPKPRDPGEALKSIQRPEVRWRIIGLVLLAIVVLWVIAGGLVGFVGPWGLVVAGVITAAVAGFGFYIWRLTRRSQQIVDILKSATDDVGRRAAIEKLSQAKDSDAMAKLARAQLLSQEDPAEAMAILESVDLKKAPGVVQDDVRANLALLYLVHGRPKDARPLADEIHLDRQPQAKAKALYAAVLAETFARTGKAEEARKLVETYQPNDPEYGEVIALIYRAQVYTYMATKNRGLARKAMEALAALDPNMVAPFMMKGVRPELKELAKSVFQSTGAVPRQKMRVLRK